VALTVTIVSTPTLCLNRAGVSSAMILPSMIATRPQSSSASYV
jgi:hypothetical protein